MIYAQFICTILCIFPSSEGFSESLLDKLCMKVDLSTNANVNVHNSRISRYVDLCTTRLTYTTESMKVEDTQYRGRLLHSGAWKISDISSPSP